MPQPASVIPSYARPVFDPQLHPERLDADGGGRDRWSTRASIALALAVANCTVFSAVITATLSAISPHIRACVDSRSYDGSPECMAHYLIKSAVPKVVSAAFLMDMLLRDPEGGPLGMAMREAVHVTSGTVGVAASIALPYAVGAISDLGCSGESCPILSDMREGDGNFVARSTVGVVVLTASVIAAVAMAVRSFVDSVAEEDDDGSGGRGESAPHPNGLEAAMERTTRMALYGRRWMMMEGRGGGGREEIRASLRPKIVRIAIGSLTVSCAASFMLVVYKMVLSGTFRPRAAEIAVISVVSTAATVVRDLAVAIATAKERRE